MTLKGGTDTLSENVDKLPALRNIPDEKTNVHNFIRQFAITLPVTCSFNSTKKSYQPETNK